MNSYIYEQIDFAKKFGANPSVQYINNNIDGGFIKLETQNRPARIWVCGRYVYMVAGGVGGSSPVRSHVYRTPILAGGHGGNFRYPVKKNVVDDAYVFGEWQKINDTSCLNIYKKESNNEDE
jgi:hypothetical protein